VASEVRFAVAPEVRFAVAPGLVGHSATRLLRKPAAGRYLRENPCLDAGPLQTRDAGNSGAAAGIADGASSRPTSPGVGGVAGPE
jgi:hypothetical protein